MVAVARHHAHVAVHILSGPVSVFGELVESPYPGIVALHVGLVHHIEAQGVHHGVHLRLARIVGRAYRVDIGLLHHRQVLHHRLHVDGPSVFGMRVLGVDTLEEDTLAVDIDEVRIFRQRDGAETILRVERHLFRAVGSTLAHRHII